MELTEIYKELEKKFEEAVSDFNAAKRIAKASRKQRAKISAERALLPIEEKADEDAYLYMKKKYKQARSIAEALQSLANDWLRTEQSKRMIEAISTSKKCEVSDLSMNQYKD